ncbi:MAG: ECF-type sigma factor [Planctomycetota bacterium]|jgi:RNA polymerase sigma factor (TIGR02999 family)
MTSTSDGHERDAAPVLDERGRPTTELLAAVYDQLRALAQQRLRTERVGHTLTATALVHEAYLRLSQGRRVPWASEAHYYVAASDAMRQILLDHARSKGRAKRGGGRQRVPISVLDLAAEPDANEIMALDEHLCRLEKENPEAAMVVRLRFYAGLTIDRTADVLGQSPRQVDRLWAYARAWLYRAMQDG